MSPTKVDKVDSLHRQIIGSMLGEEQAEKAINLLTKSSSEVRQKVYNLVNIDGHFDGEEVLLSLEGLVGKLSKSHASSYPTTIKSLNLLLDGSKDIVPSCRTFCTTTLPEKPTKKYVPVKFAVKEPKKAKRVVDKKWKNAPITAPNWKKIKPNSIAAFIIEEIESGATKDHLYEKGRELYSKDITSSINTTLATLPKKYGYNIDHIVETGIYMITGGERRQGALYRVYSDGSREQAKRGRIKKIK